MGILLFTRARIPGSTGFPSFISAFLSQSYESRLLKICGIQNPKPKKNYKMFEDIFFCDSLCNDIFGSLKAVLPVMYVCVIESDHAPLDFSNLCLYQIPTTKSDRP